MERKLTAILAADVVGYSRLIEQDEAGTHEQLQALIRDMFEPKIAAHHGRVVKTTGDGLLAEFPSVVEAVQCGVEFEEANALRNADLPDGRRLDFRIGINLGDVIVDGSDIYGDGVIVASRLEGMADPGGICISEAAFNQVKNKIPLHVEDLGETSVKNMSEPVIAYRVVLDKSRSTPRRRWVRWKRAAAAIAVLVALTAAGGASFWYFRAAPEPTKRLALPLVAVVPFQNISADPKEEYFCDGLTNDLTTDLTRIRYVMVLAASTTFTFKNKSIDVAAIHRDYGVDYILEGSLQQIGDRIRINVQLIDAARGIHLWATRFDRPKKDLFAVQDEILGAVISKLSIELTEAEKRRVLAQATDDLGAYELWLKGRHIFTNGTTRDDNRQAQDLLRSALAKDPDFVSAKADLAHTYVKEWRHNWWEVSAEDSLAKAADHAMGAVAMGQENEDAHVVMAIVHLVRGEFEEALASYERATELMGGHANPDLTAEVGFAYMYMNREPEGIAKLEEVLRTNPVHPWWYESALAWGYYQNHQYDEAIRVINSLKPIVNDVRMILAASYAQKGEAEKAKAIMAAFLQNETWTIADEAGAPFVDPNDEKHWLDGLRLAGMPEGEGKTSQP